MPFGNLVLNSYYSDLNNLYSKFTYLLNFSLNAMSLNKVNDKYNLFGPNKFIDSFYYSKNLSLDSIFQSNLNNNNNDNDIFMKYTGTSNLGLNTFCGWNYSLPNIQTIFTERPKVNIRSERPDTSNYNNKVVEKAASYLGKVNSDLEGNRLFSPKNYASTDWYKKHGSWGWCADFATSVVDDIYGNKLPKGFKNSSPIFLEKWAIKNGCYNAVPQQNRATWITQNVKPGDIMVSKGSGPSGMHVAIVSKVNSDGSIETIDGNSKNSVRRVTRQSNNNYRGFISFNKFA